MPSPAPAAAWIARLTLSDYRNYAQVAVNPGPGTITITGPNGSGKTNLVEAISMLAPGRGLRGAAIGELARDGGPGGWAVAAELNGPFAAQLGTGADASAPDRRVARVNGAAASISALGERLALVWLTPAMDRLLAEGAAARRRFLDRLTLALDPAHGRHATRYEAAMRERTRLLTGDRPPDPAWLAGLERAMGEHGAAMAAGRRALVDALEPLLSVTPAPFPPAGLSYEDPTGDGGALAEALRMGRRADTAAGRALIGPHRADLVVIHAPSGQSAERASTGEQKALLTGVLLAHADLVAARRGAQPILLLDEVTAHFDRNRRGALFERLSGLGQVWMTGTEPELFDGLGQATRFHVDNGAIRAS